MKDFMPERERVEVIACFGDARFVRTSDLKYELRDGSEADRKTAEDWVARFFPDLLAICRKS